MQELSLVNNPLKDNRLRKMCEQKALRLYWTISRPTPGKRERAGEKAERRERKGASNWTRRRLRRLESC